MTSKHTKSTNEESLLDEAVEDIRTCIDAGSWAGVDRIMRRHRTAFAATERRDVILFVAEIMPGLEAGRARAEQDGWHVPTDDRTIWESPRLHAQTARPRP
jgi:hypothetical protein